MDRLLTLVRLLVVSGCAVLAGCKPETAPVAEAPQPVRVVKVALTDREIARSYTGTVKARIESDLGFRVAGKITERLVDIGKSVAAGDVIARLDATDYLLALESQQAELRAATSSRDQAVAAEGRYRELLPNGYVSKAGLEQRTAVADEARQRVEKAVRAIATAKNQVAYTELRANAAGVIAAIPAEVGQVVAAGQTVAKLVKAGELEVQVAIPEQQLDALKTAIATVQLWSHGAQSYGAVLREIAPQADSGSRTYEARFTISAPDAHVALGMTATVTLQADGGGKVARLPLAAVLNDGRGASVFVLDEAGTHIMRTPIEVVSYGQDEVIVGGGLIDGQRVVALGTHVLDDHRPVRIVELLASADLVPSALQP